MFLLEDKVLLLFENRYLTKTTLLLFILYLFKKKSIDDNLDKQFIYLD